MKSRLAIIGALAVILSGCAATTDAPTTTPSPIITKQTSEPTPTPEPTPVPTPTPIPTPTPVPVPVKLVKGTGSVNQRGSATLTIRTIAKAKCSIDVQYDSGSSTAKGLGTKTADADGLISWKWLVGSNTAAGEWPILVTCVLGDRSGDLPASITVK